MAQVPTVGTPQVSPNTNPTPFADVRAAPDAFLGTALGQGAAQVGAASEHVSDALQQHAIQFQQLNNTVVANKAAFAASDAVNQYLTDYKTQNTGLKAFANQGQAYTDLDALATKGGSGLPLPAQLEYDQYVRRQVGVAKQQLTSYAVDQRKWETGKVADYGDEQARSTFATNYTSPEAETQFYTTVANGVKMRQDVGLLPSDDTVTRAAIQEGLSKGYGSVVKSIYDTQGQPAAEAYFNAHRANFTPEAATQIEGTFRVASHANAIDNIVLGLGGHGGNLSLDAITGLERSGDSAVSPKGAVSRYQITQATANTYGWDYNRLHTDPAYAKDKAGELLGKYQQEFPGDAAAQAIAWNAGPAWVPKWEAAGRNNSMLPPETQHYLERQGHGAAPLTIGAQGDPEQYVAGYVSRAQGYVEAHPELAAADRIQIVQRARQVAEINAAPIKAQQDANFTTILGAIDGGAQDPTALQKQYPAEWNGLRESQRHQLIGYATREGNLATPDRERNSDVLTGMLATNPTAFAGLDLTKYDTTLNDHKKFVQAQGKLQGQALQINQQVDSALSQPMAQNFLRSGGYGKDSPQYLEFAGGLQGKIEAWETQHNGVAPKGQDLNNIIGQVTAQKARSFWNGQPTGPANFEVPAEVRNQIVQGFTAKYHRAPNEQEIAYRYSLSQPQ